MFEINQNQAKMLVAFGGALLLCLGSLTFVFGVPALVTLTILLTFLIVLLTALGCSLHLREIERFEEAEVLDKMREKIELHMALIHEILAPAKSRLVNCEKQVGERPGLIDGSIKNFYIARQLIDALEERLDALVTLMTKSNGEQIVAAHEITESPLRVKRDAGNAVATAEPLPDLDTHLWRDTLDMLLLQIEKQIQSKTGAEL